MKTLQVDRSCQLISGMHFQGCHASLTRQRGFEGGLSRLGRLTVEAVLLLFDFYLSLRREAAVEADQYSGCILVENSNLTTWTHDDGLNSLGGRGRRYCLLAPPGGAGRPGWALWLRTSRE